MVALMESILEKINLASLNLLVPMTSEEAYSIIVKEAAKLVNAQYGSLILMKDGNLKRVYTTLPIADEVKIRKKGFTYSAYIERKVFVMHENDFMPFHPALKKIGIKSNVFIPLAYREESLGVLILNSNEEEYFTQKELRVLKVFGSLASLKIKNTQLYNETIKALEVRDLFISMAAHELRTPLTTINGYVQLLNQRLKNNKSQETKWVKELFLETKRMTKLIDELLTVNRIRSGQLNFEWKECSLKQVMQRALSDFSFTYPSRVVIVKDLIKEKEDLVIGDFDKLLQVMINLLDNAAKFSAADSSITVSLKTEGATLNLSVTDQGKGIKRKEKDKVFDVFYKGDHIEKSGMGLGLFLAKHIIVSHRGLISIHSQINEGSTVIVKLPKLKI